ncbi:hypothetical protein [Phycicoccus avicenniae]|uniref:hypothetical protein n=1 Tax=Phycicoccus avicenniae TaxID=2828860 RepID=UPI003D29C8F7
MSSTDSSEPSIIAGVNRDLGEAVRHAGAHTLSPFVAAQRLEYELGPLRHRVQLLAQRRPDLLERLAEHWGCRPSPVDVDEELTEHAHHLLIRRHAHAGGHLDALTEPVRRPDLGTSNRLLTSQDLARREDVASATSAHPQRRDPN